MIGPSKLPSPLPSSSPFCRHQYGSHQKGFECELAHDAEEPGTRHQHRRQVYPRDDLGEREAPPSHADGATLPISIHIHRLGLVVPRSGPVDLDSCSGPSLGPEKLTISFGPGRRKTRPSRWIWIDIDCEVYPDRVPAKMWCSAVCLNIHRLVPVYQGGDANVIAASVKEPNGRISNKAAPFTGRGLPRSLRRL